MRGKDIVRYYSHSKGGSRTKHAASENRSRQKREDQKENEVRDFLHLKSQGNEILIQTSGVVTSLPIMICPSGCNASKRIYRRWNTMGSVRYLEFARQFGAARESPGYSRDNRVHPCCASSHSAFLMITITIVSSWCPYERLLAASLSRRSPAHGLLLCSAGLDQETARYSSTTKNRTKVQ